MRRIKLTVAYDGTAYCGWQVQPNGITVQEVLNNACTDLFGKKIQTIGASRTDAGVHARGQVAVFDTDARMPAEKVAYALNTRLPADIRIQKSCEVPSEFHPRFAQTVKTYEYGIYHAPFEDPTKSRYSAHVYGPLDLRAMQQACQYLIGEQDFASFQASGTGDQIKSTVRTIYSAEILLESDGCCAQELSANHAVQAGQTANSRPVAAYDSGMLRFRITGNGFLYHMVRIIAGSLIEIGRGRHEPEWMREIILAQNREQAGPTAVAKGLTLVRIRYPEWE